MSVSPGRHFSSRTNFAFRRQQELWIIEEPSSGFYADAGRHGPIQLTAPLNLVAIRTGGPGGDAFNHSSVNKVDEAREILNRLADQGRGDYVDPYQIVLAHLGLEDHDSMFAALDRALVNRSRDIMLIPVNPMLDPVRSDPRLEIFLEKAGLDWVLQKWSPVAP